MSTSVKDQARSCALDLASSADSPRIARDAVTGFLADLDLSEGSVADAELITSELVSNAVAVASIGCGVQLRVVVDDGRLRIEVDDDGPGRPTVGTGTELGGFGLQVVEALSERWGTDLASQHKTVWAVLPVS